MRACGWLSTNAWPVFCDPLSSGPSYGFRGQIDLKFKSFLNAPFTCLSVSLKLQQTMAVIHLDWIFTALQEFFWFMAANIAHQCSFTVYLCFFCAHINLLCVWYRADHNKVDDLFFSFFEEIQNLFFPTT